MKTTSTTSHFADILAAFDASLELRQATRPDHGIVNDVWFLETADADFVLKTYGDDAGSRKPQQEAVVCATMRALGVPAPEVYVVDASRSVAPFIWSLSERLPGEVYASASLSDDTHRGIYAQLGHIVGTLHASTFPEFGALCGERDVGPMPGLVGDRGPFRYWADMHDAIIESRLHLIAGTEFSDRISGVARWLHSRRRLIEGEIVPRLLHMDLHQGNILVRDGQVTGIIDVEESIIGHNEYDLMRTELAMFRDHPPALEEAFRGAYAEHVTLDDGYRQRRDFYEMSRTLAWISSLLLNGTGYGAAHDRAMREAAGSQLTTLLNLPEIAP